MIFRYFDSHHSSHWVLFSSCDPPSSWLSSQTIWQVQTTLQGLLLLQKCPELLEGKEKDTTDAAMIQTEYSSKTCFLPTVRTARTRACCPTIGVAKKVNADFIREKNISWWRWSNVIFLLQKGPYSKRYLCQKLCVVKVGIPWTW